MAKKILVTGGAGFIGSHLCEKLRDRGETVISLDNYSTGKPENHIEGVDYRECDTRDITSAISEKIDLIFHLGEYARVEQSFRDIKKCFEYNCSGTKAVLELTRDTGAKLVYAGSSTKFADGGIGRDQSPYAWSKASNTELVRNYGQWFDVPYAITYFFNAYGPRERADKNTGTLIGIYKELYQERKPLPVRLPGSQRRNFTHVSDITDGLIMVGDRGEGDEYGLGHPDSYSVEEVVKFFGAETIRLPERPGNRMNSPVDTKRARLELGWSPKYNLPDYIKSNLK